MPQFDPTYFISQLVWLAVVLVSFYFLVTRIALPRIGEVIEARTNQIAGDLERARTLKMQTEEVVAAYESSLAAARAEAGSLMAATQAEIGRKAAEREAAFAKDLAVKVSRAEQRIAAARDEVEAQVRDIAVGAALDVTRKLVGSDPDAAAVGGAVDRALRETV